MKACKKCGVEKPLTEFKTVTNRSGKRYYLGACNDCDIERHRERRRRMSVAPTVTEKQCSDCGEMKPASSFHRVAANTDGLRGRCRDCHKNLPCRQGEARQRERRKIARREGREYDPSRSNQRARQAHAREVRERISAVRTIERVMQGVWTAWMREHATEEFQRAYRNARFRDRYYSNLDEQRARARNYKHANPDKADRYDRRRKRRAARQSDGTLTRGVIGALFQRASRCPYCGERIAEGDKTLDHLDPISHGGVHGISNVAICCRACNTRKHSKTFARWLAELDAVNARRARRLYVRTRKAHPSQPEMPLVYDETI